MLCILEKNKNVILIFTMHNDTTIYASTRDKKKLEIITTYNLTKADKNVIDEKKNELILLEGIIILGVSITPHATDHVVKKVTG